MKAGNYLSYVLGIIALFFVLIFASVAQAQVVGGSYAGFAVSSLPFGGFAVSPLSATYDGAGTYTDTNGTTTYFENYINGTMAYATGWLGLTSDNGDLIINYSSTSATNPFADINVLGRQ